VQGISDLGTQNTIARCTAGSLARKARGRETCASALQESDIRARWARRRTAFEERKAQEAREVATKLAAMDASRDRGVHAYLLDSCQPSLSPSSNTSMNGLLKSAGKMLSLQPIGFKTALPQRAMMQ